MSRLDRFRVVHSRPGVGVDPPMKAGRDKSNDFARVPLKWAAEVAKATNSPGDMVFILLAYLTWKTKSPTFVLSNDYLKRYGVNREAKRRVLARLEKAGVIKVQRQGLRSPLVTLLIKPTSGAADP
jgi:hypothetical protein